VIGVQHCSKTFQRDIGSDVSFGARTLCTLLLLRGNNFASKFFPFLNSTISRIQVRILQMY